MVPPGYWSARHSSRIEDPCRVFRAAERLVGRVPPPWESPRRGRRPKFSPRRHAAVCLLRQYFGLTLREVEGLAPGLLGTSMDHSTVGWAFKRLRPGYLSLLLALLHRELSRRVEVDFYVADSTGISTPRLVRQKRAFVVVRVHETLKLHALIGYSAPAGALLVASARVTRSNVHDGTQLPHLIRGMRGGGRPLLADSAYGSEANAELLRRRGFLPVLRPHGQARRGIGTRMRMKEFWRNRRLYRRRGIAEALFGGLANRYGSRTGSRRVRTKVVSIMLMLVAHNLRTLLRLQAWEGGEVLILWNYSTPMLTLRPSTSSLLLPGKPYITGGEERRHLSAVQAAPCSCARGAPYKPSRSEPQPKNRGPPPPIP